MPTKEVICISSDDESDPKKVKKPSEDSAKKDKTKKSEKFKKRKASADLESPKPKKRVQPTMLSKLKKRETRSTSDDGIQVLQVVPSSSSEPSTSGISYANKSRSTVELIDEHLASALTSEGPQSNGKNANDSDAYSEASARNKSAKLTEAPQLIIKEKRPVESDTVGHEVFVQFLSQCLSRDRSPQMEKILQKLKRHYEQLDPQYAHSPAFINLLNEKRECLLSGDSYLYVHISDVDKEMKCRKRSTPQPKSGELKEEIGGENDALDPKVYAKVKKILAVMEKCQERIKRLEEAEVDWSDEDNSNYLKVSKYKERMSQLYYKYCELTGEHEDAGRPYLRPKCLKVTKIVSVDQAIISFINKKLTDKVKKFKKGLSAADCVIFPDYCDILNCIRECNKAQKLGMDKKGEETLARKAFKDLGEYLQTVRQRDFFDTFSLMYENKKDPALENPELLEKLNQNKVEGKKKLNAVFEEFVKKQEEGLSKSSENGSDDDNKQDNRGEDNSEEEEDEGAENDDLDDIDDISLQESEISVAVEDEAIEAIQTRFSKNSSEKADGNKAVLLKNKILHSQETVITERPAKVQKPHRVIYEADEVFVNTNRIVAISDGTVESTSNSSSRLTFPIDGPTCQGNRVVLEGEGTVTLAKKDIHCKKILEKASSDKKSSKPGPQSSKTVVKPSIRNIQNVRVVIKGNDIVKINGSITQMKNSDIKSQVLTEIQETSTENSLAGFLDSKEPIDKRNELSSQNSSTDILEKLNNSSIKILDKKNDKLSTAEEPEDVTIIDEKNICTEPSPSKAPETAHQIEAQCKLFSEEQILLENIEESEVKSVASVSSTVGSVESASFVEDAVKQVQSIQNSTSKAEQLDDKNSLVTLETSLSSLNKINLKSSKVKSKIISTLRKNTPNASSSVRSQNSSVLKLKISEMSERHEISQSTKEDIQDSTNGDESSSTKQLSIETIIIEEISKIAKSDSSQSSTQVGKVIDKDKEVVDEKSERQIGEERPILKVRSFAKPPDSWKSSQENSTQTLKNQTPTSTPKQIEIVDLDDENDQTNILTPILTTTLQKNQLDATGNKSSYGDVHIVINVPRNTSPKTKIDINLKRSPIETSNTATIATGVASSLSSLPSSTSSSVSQLPQSIQTNVRSGSTCTPTGRVIGKVRPMKGRVIAVDKAIIVPLGTSLSSNRVLPTTQTQVNLQKTRIHLINNTASVSSSILKTSNKSVYVNPVNQKVLNPLSRQSVIQKPVTSGQSEKNKIN